MRHSSTNIKYDISSKRSIHYPILRQDMKRDLSGSHYVHMLTEDLHLGIMPFGGRTKNKEFNVTINPSNSKVEELIRAGLPTHYGEPYDDLKESICKFIDEATHILACYGVAYYEIVYYYKKDSKKPVKFDFCNISNNNIKNIFGVYWQYISKDSLKHLGIKRRFIWLPRKNILKIILPRNIGGPFKHRRLLGNLAWLSKQTIPKFVLEDMKEQKQQPGYDFTIYNRNSRIYLGKLTKHLGWPARGLINEWTLEIYELYKYLKFEKTKAFIREAILNSLNKALVKIGKKMGFNVQIEINGMPSISELDASIDKLIKGELPFSKVVEVMKRDL